MLLQSFVAGLHLLNAGMATITRNPTATLICSAILLMCQTYLQSAGNAATPPVNPPRGGSTIAVKTLSEGNVAGSDAKSGPRPPSGAKGNG